MRLSHQVQYAICAVFDLAYNGHEAPVQVRIISDRQAVPMRYLEQIFQRLRKGGLVVSKRGPGGGYLLARPAAEITLRQIVEAVEGRVEDLQPISQPPSAFRPDFLWGELAEGFAEVLAATSVDDLCRLARQRAVEREASDAPMYVI